MNSVLNVIDTGKNTYFESKIEQEVDCVDEVMLMRADSKPGKVSAREDVLEASIYVNKDAIIGFDDLDSESTFYDVFGFNEEFKQLFNALDMCTNLPEEEISKNLRYNLEGSILYMNAIFKFNIKTENVVQK